MPVMADAIGSFFHGLFFCPFPLSLGTSSQVLISGNLPKFSADHRSKEGTVAHPVLHDGGTTCPHTTCSRPGIWGEVSKYEKSPPPSAFLSSLPSGFLCWSPILLCLCLQRLCHALVKPGCLMRLRSAPHNVGWSFLFPPPTRVGRWITHCFNSPFSLQKGTNCSHPFPKGSSQDFAEPQVAPT